MSAFFNAGLFSTAHIQPHIADIGLAVSPQSQNQVQTQVLKADSSLTPQAVASVQEPSLSMLYCPEKAGDCVVPQGWKPPTSEVSQISNVMAIPNVTADENIYFAQDTSSPLNEPVPYEEVKSSDSKNNLAAYALMGVLGYLLLKG